MANEIRGVRQAGDRTFLPAVRVCGVRLNAGSAMVVFSMDCFGSIVVLAVYYRISPAAADVSA